MSSKVGLDSELEDRVCSMLFGLIFIVISSVSCIVDVIPILVLVFILIRILSNFPIPAHCPSLIPISINFFVSTLGHPTPNHPSHILILSLILIHPFISWTSPHPTFPHPLPHPQPHYPHPHPLPYLYPHLHLHFHTFPKHHPNLHQ